MVRRIASSRALAAVAIVAAAAASILPGGCRDERADRANEPPPVHAFGGPTMGSSYEVKFVSDVPTAAVRALVETELRAFDEAFSNWRDDSEIARVNAHRSTEPIAVSERFARVLERALEIARATDGAFDPTLKPLSDLYRRAKAGEPHALAPEALDAARANVGHALVAVVDGAVRKQRPEVALDLDGLVAGAAIDAIAAKLRSAGVASFYLQVTGEVYCAGDKGAEAWHIGVVDPGSDVAGGDVPVRVLPLRDRALCTSGDYRNAVVVDGRVQHHVFDPRTGRNPEHAVVSASVLADSCAVADAVGTALMVMGEAQTRARWTALRALGVRGVLMLEPGDESAWREIEIEWPSDDS